MNQILRRFTDGRGWTAYGRVTNPWLVSRRILAVSIVAFWAQFPPLLTAQPSSPETRAKVPPLAVFLDCSACDSVYVRTAIPWINYVRDRTDAQVHVLETSLPTGAGGVMYTVAFLGRGVFGGVNDTLRWATAPAVTSDSIRRGLAHLLQLGLVRYVAASDVGQMLTVHYHLPANENTASRLLLTVDPWNGWVFSTGVAGYVSGQESQTNGTVSSSASADRTTKALKMDLGVSESYTWSRYDLPGEGTFRTVTRGYNISGQMLHGLGEHWSLGEHAEVGNSSYDNERLWVRLAPAVEYDLFPYSEATNRQLAIQSSLGVVHMQFVDTTLENRLALTSGDWRTSVAYVATQPWGSASVSLTTAALLTDFRQQNVNLSASWNLRLIKGLSFSPSGSVSLVRNQPYLARSGLTPEEVLTQQQQLATSYTYSLTVGLTYAFGSSFNGVVNPRFTTGNVLSASVGAL